MVLLFARLRDMAWLALHSRKPRKNRVLGCSTIISSRILPRIFALKNISSFLLYPLDGLSNL
jgi:hypothetical protein